MACYAGDGHNQGEELKKEKKARCAERKTKMKNKTKTKKTRNKTLLSNTYLINDGNKTHTICAENLIVSGNGLVFEKDGNIVAWFIVWNWWKKVDA